jgi:hypothetical protein
VVNVLLVATQLLSLTNRSVHLIEVSIGAVVTTPLTIVSTDVAGVVLAEPAAVETIAALTSVGFSARFRGLLYSVPPWMLRTVVGFAVPGFEQFSIFAIRSAHLIVVSMGAVTRTPF